MDYLNRNAAGAAIRRRLLNIRHGNGASIVVRAGENLVHGEGKQLTFLMQLKENVRDIMRNPANVLNSLSAHSRNSGYRFERLYRVLFNEEMYYLAYQNMYAKPGNMTAGSDGKTIDEMSIARIETLINTLKNETYQPNPAKRVYIPKKNGKKRPLGIPSFDDKLVQEVMRMMLEAIYEGSFEYTSHGFRPSKSCHTALLQIQKTYTATKWFIEGDIKGFFDNINHDVLINILSERIEDERFIRLIRKFLNAGYIEDWKFNNTYSGTPQGGIISPILANVYLDKLDKYMKEYVQNFNKGVRRQTTLESKQIEKTKRQLLAKLKIEKDDERRAILVQQIKKIDKDKVLIPYSDPMDENYKRLQYTRYADDFLIGIIGSKTDSIKVKEDVKAFLANKLKLELSDEKTLITHANTPAKFLGFDIYVDKSDKTKRNKLGHLKRVFDKKVILSVSLETVRKKLMDLGALKLDWKSDHEHWLPTSRLYLKNNDDLEILTRYNAEIRGYYNYYSIANNVQRLHSFHYVMQYSMYKTFARKYNTTMYKILTQYKRDGIFTVSYTNNKGKTLYRTLYNDGFKRKNEQNHSFSDLYPNTLYTLTRTSLMDRLKARKCELCGAEENLEMHHIRQMKDVLKGRENWQVIMLARRRKTMAVCFNCHRKIHYGKID